MAVKFKNTININDQYTFPTAVGVDGQYLSITDAAAGTLDWTDLGTISGAQSNFIYYDAKNSTGSSIPVGTAVMAVGTDGNSGHILIAPMQANGTVEPKFFIGVTDTAIGNGEIGKVVHFGVIDQVNTNAFSDGDVLWCNPTVPGGFTVTEPEAPAVKLATAIVLNSATNGKLLVRVQGNEGIHELHDVHIEDVTNGQALVWDATQGYWKNGDVASGGAGASTLVVEKNEFTGDGATVAFTISSPVQSESQTQVYIDGVYQSKSNYSTSGSVITFSEAPESGTDIEVIHLLSVSAVVKTDEFTGNGSTSEYTLSQELSSENNTQVYFDGVYQSKSTYSVSGTTITFSENVPSGVAIEVVHLKAVDISALNSSLIIGDGTTTDFTLPQAVDSKDKTFVFLQGVYQEKSTYSLDGTTISFNTAPQNGYTIEVITFASISLFDAPNITAGDGISVTGTYPDVVISNTQTAPLKYTTNVISVATNAEHGNLYVLTADLTLTLPASPEEGDSIKISNLSGVDTCVIGANGNNIMATSGDMTLDDATKSFELIYTDSTNGWVIIG